MTDDSRRIDVPDDFWRIDVSDDDVAAAKDAWMSACESGAAQERVDRLRSDLEQLWRTQAKQLIQAFWRGETGGPVSRGAGPASSV